MRRAFAAVALLAASLLAGGDIDMQVVDDPRVAILPDRRSEQAWAALFDPNPQWVTREVAALAIYHPERLPTLWAARLLYRGEPWTRRPNEPSSLRRWRAADREVKMAILRDIRWRRDRALVPGLAAFLSREDGDPGLAISALAGLVMTSPQDGLAAAVRIADPRRADRLAPAGLPGVRTFALHLILDTLGPAGPDARAALEWALLTADGAERLTALTLLPAGSATDLVTACLQRIAAQAAKGALNDDGTAAVVIACARLGDAIGEAAARTLAEFAATAPREVACAAAASLARSVTWRNAIDPEPLTARLARESDPAVRHALLGVLLRLSPGRIAGIPGADPWAALARHRQSLTDWAWRQYMK